MSTVAHAQLPLPCGCKIGLLIQIDASSCDDAPAPCIQAETIARLLLREWFREEIQTRRPA